MPFHNLIPDTDKPSTKPLLADSQEIYLVLHWLSFAVHSKSMERSTLLMIVANCYFVEQSYGTLNGCGD